ADLDTPALGGAIADGLDDAERLVPGYEREAHRQDAGVLLGIAAADAASLDSQQPGVVGHLRQRELPPLERARSGLDDGAAGARRHLPVENSTTAAAPRRPQPASCDGASASRRDAAEASDAFRGGSRTGARGGDVRRSAARPCRGLRAA